MLTTAPTACNTPLEVRECESLLEHYVELLVETRYDEPTAQEIARHKQEAVTLARKNPTFELGECADKVSRRQYECAMSAPTVDDVEKCLLF